MTSRRIPSEDNDNIMIQAFKRAAKSQKESEKRTMKWFFSIISILFIIWVIYVIIF